MNSLVSNISPAHSGLSSWSPSFSMFPASLVTFNPISLVSSLAPVAMLTVAIIVCVVYGSISGSLHSLMSVMYTHTSSGNSSAVDVVSTHSVSTIKSLPTQLTIFQSTLQSDKAPIPGNVFQITLPVEPSLVDVWLCRDGVSGTFPALVMLTTNSTILPGALVLTALSTDGSMLICMSQNSFTVTWNMISSRSLVLCPVSSG